MELEILKQKSFERKQGVTEYLKSKRQLREKVEKYKRDVLSQDYIIVYIIQILQMEKISEIVS